MIFYNSIFVLSRFSIILVSILGCIIEKPIWQGMIYLVFCCFRTPEKVGLAVTNVQRQLSLLLQNSTHSCLCCYKIPDLIVLAVVNFQRQLTLLLQNSRDSCLCCCKKHMFWVLIRSAELSTQNICFHREIRKYLSDTLI